MANYTIQDVQEYLNDQGHLPPWQVGQPKPDFFDERTRGIILADPNNSGGMPVRPDGTVDYDAYTKTINPAGNPWLPFLLASGALAGVVGPAVAAGAGAAEGAGAGASVGAAGEAGGLTAADLGIDTIGPWTTNPSLAELGGNVGGGFTLPSTPPGTGSALTRLLGLDPKTSDILDVAGKAGSTFLGLAGANAQGDAYRDVANQFMQLGAGDRARLEASYAPGFDIWKQPGYDSLLSGVTNAQLRGLSTHGNPYGDPGALATMNKNILSTIGVPALTNYRGQLLTGGGTGLTSAAQGALMNAGTAKSPYDVLSTGIASMTTPQTSESELLDLIRRAGTGGNYKLAGGYTGTPA